MTAIKDTMTTAWRFIKEGRFAEAKRLSVDALQENPQLVEAWHLQGMANFHLGLLDQAEPCLRKVVAERPDMIDAHAILGMALASQGRVAEAVDPFRMAVALDPSRANAHHNLGTALQDLGRLEAAEVSFRETLRLDPGHAVALVSLSNILLSRERHADLADIVQKIVTLRPELVEPRLRLGDAFLRLERFDEAVSCFQEAVALAPRDHTAHAGLGIALAALKRLDEAIPCFERSLDLEPNQPIICKNLGIALRDLVRLDEALASFDRLLAIHPDFVDAHFNRGLTFARRGDDALALECMEQAVRLAPDRPELYSGLGLILGYLGRLDEAADQFDRTIRHMPDHANAHLNRSMNWLLQGDYARGWPEYEWRLEGKEFSPRRLAEPRWRGEPLAGRTILLHAEQGLGDTLQFIRYAPLVKKRGGRVLVECQGPLVRLVSTCSGVDQVCARNDPLPAFNVQAALLSLPHIFGTTLDTIPGPIPYLSADPASIAEWAEQLAPIAGFRVGIAWQGTTKHLRDRSRSFPLILFETLARIEGVRLISLQRGHGVEQLHALRDRFPVIDFGDSVDADLAEMKDTPAMMMSLDLVITPDTSLAHLAGALGVPVWIPIAHVPDFRWLLDREDSPWYATARLFRRGQTGDWEDVFERMAHALANRAISPVMPPVRNRP